MAISKNTARQWPLVATVEFAGGDTTAASANPAIDLPGGAIVIGGSFSTAAGFTGDGTIAIQVGSEVLLAAADYDAASGEVFFTAGGTKNAGTTVDVVVAVAALTDGAARLTVVYIIDERSNEVQP